MKKIKLRISDDIFTPEIVEVEKETKKYVFVNGRKCMKTTDWYCYFDTLQLAKEGFKKRVLRDIEIQESRIKYAEKSIEKYKLSLNQPNLLNIL